MIKKSLYSFIVLFLIHTLFVTIYPNLGFATNQWQDNIIKAQVYLYSDDIDTAMVGSSLSARILKDSIPSVNSISFGGCSVEDGLSIILSKKQKPKYILVETNYFLRKGNPYLVKKLTTGLMPQIKKYIPCLREKNEPICLISGLFIHVIGINPQAATTSVNIDFLNRNIHEKIKSDSLTSNKLISERLHTILPLLKAVRQHGSKIIFFEMPINHQLRYLKLNCQTRQIVNRLFAQKTYTYLPYDNTSYTTTDGEHLSYTDQKKYSHFFKIAIQRIK